MATMTDSIMVVGAVGTMAGIIATGIMAAGATVLRITDSAGMAAEAGIAAEVTADGGHAIIA